jgi:hypothetical protein
MRIFLPRTRAAAQDAHMPFEPAFVRDLDSFHRDLARVRSVPEWTAFKSRWFADMPWPHRSPESIASIDAAPAVAVRGRTFHRSAMPDDLTPQARYEYMAAMQSAYAVVFPAPEDQPGAGGSGIRFTCPACELWTDQPGDPTCPQCGRGLLGLRAMPRPG